ncbi:MAG TPA: 2,3-bisphosphoglycerate-independent phosphoglycerate mutase [Spirochaetia bacterium]|nr:2,3-bisphosphoglycerate-independent phosphoglycerate mutase [Spirochaetia bacterium]
MEVLRELSVKNDKKIVFFVLDGLGGLPFEKGGKTELETASTPNLDALAAESECGLHNPLGMGITPGSAPGHLSLFGYNPIDYAVGRGVVAAMGIAFPMKAGDVAARMNFASQDEKGNITDRRAGRIPTDKCAQLCEMLKGVSIAGIEAFVKPVKDYRAVVIFRGSDLSDHVSDTDPQNTGVKPLDPRATSEKGEKTAGVAKEFIRQANAILKGQKPANAVLMRGFAELPYIPSMRELYHLTPLALAVYPDYKGISRLVGMDVIEGLSNFEEQGKALRDSWNRYDFFFIHHKYTDSKGEDGDFDGKVAEIEKADAFLPQILGLKPDVIIVTGDHSTPALCKAHSGHPVPFLINARESRPDGVKEFGESGCSRGMWGGVIKGTQLISLALAYSGKLKKFGA